MKFWLEIAASFFSYVSIGWIFLVFYLGLQWLMQVTDVSAVCDWSRDGHDYHPNFKIRNRSQTRTYQLETIAYSHPSAGLVWLDSKSLMGKEVEPLSGIEFEAVAPVKNCSSVSDCLQLRVIVRLHTGRQLWLPGQGPRHPLVERLQRTAFALRDLIDRAIAKTS
jgi:hypothetical protein